MHAALGDHLAVEMRQFLDQPDILQQGRAARASRHDVVVVGNRCAGRMGQRGAFLVGHGPGPSGRWEKRSEEHTSELQSLMRSSYAVFCLKKKKKSTSKKSTTIIT